SLLMVSLLVIPISNLYAIRFEIANDQGANHSLTILEATIDAENLVDEDEIGVFTPGGVCAGAEVIEGEGSFGIAVYADNPASEELDGFLTNQSFSFKIWDASEEMEYEAHARFLDGPRTWGVNGLTRIERLFFYTEPIPVIQPATYTYDFGVVGEDHSLDWQLIIENIGFSTLTIDNISINEDAFETGFEDDIEIEPGETSILTVVFTPDAEGEFNGILLIESDDPEYGDLEIELSGSGTNDIEPAISLSEEGYDFGDWAIELSNTWALRITNTGTDSLTIENIEIEDGAFSIDWGGALKIGPHRTYRLVVTFEPTNEEAYESDLTISSDDPNNGELTIPIRGNGIDWEFHFYHPGVQEQWHFLLSLETLLNGEYLNVGDEIGVFTPEGNCGGMRAITENADPEGMIGITTYGDNDSTDFVEGFRDGEEWHFILWDVSTGVETIADIEYDDDEQPQEWHNERLTAVRLSGESDPVPEISVSTADIDFGEIAANLTSEREINITNNGAGELHVTNIATVEDDYFYTDIEVGFVLASEESRAITLTFEPDDVANYEAELHVFSNSPRNGEIVIALSGSGTEPPQTIEVEENPHDFGVIEIENQAVWTMVMINTGWSDLRIDRIEIDNDAYSHNFENAEVLGRDETHEVEVTFAPDQEGNFDTILTIFSDDPENGEFPVTLLGEGGVVPAIEIVPENIDFGNVTVDEVLARRFTINSRGSGDLTVTDISVVGQGFSVNFEDDFVLSPDESQLIPVYFTPEDDRDYNAEVIVTSDDQNNGEVSVGVSGSGEMLPQDITLRYVADEEYGVEFEIQDVDADVQAGTRGVRAVDIDDDGDTDVIGAHRTHVSWWENDGDQNFDVHLINDDVNRAYWVEFADVDLDGDMDILSAADAQEDDGITWWENDGDQNFAEHSIEGGFSSKSIFGIDIDNDNDIDIVASDYDGDQVSWWENDGLGDFTKHSLVEDWDRPYMVYPIDLDEDGDIDVVASATGARRIVWFRNNGDQSFTLVDIAGIDAQGIYVCDIDSDDDLDVVAADSDGAQVEWFENDGNEDFTRHVIMEDFEYAQSVWADDFDDDGDMDIVAGHQRSPYIAYFENDGEENFSLTDISQGLSGNPVSLYSSDIDSDGDADILCSDNSDRFAWWENQFEVSHDFGEVEFDAPDTWSFVIANVGDQVLRITDITPDPNDGIYTTDFDGQIDIDPGETTEIEVIFHPDAEGVFNCTLNIDSDDPDEETLTVTLTGIGDPGQRDPVIPNPIEDIQLAEDFDPLTVANLNLVFSDPDGDDLTFDVFTDDENFIAQIVDDTLLVFDSADDWNGNVLVTVVADDGVARDDDSRAVRQLRFVARSNSQSGDQMMLNEGLTGLSEAHPRRDASAEDTVEVTVTPVNDDPEWVDFPEDTITVAEGDTIEFSVTGADIDNDADELSIEYLIPEGAQFQDNSNGTGDFTWQTSDDSEGDYTVRLILSDPDELTDTVWVNISVGHV
ncbi:MAG: choice-of-anchor D domain-containing protein, partial [Calditrichaeota bacterium]|nr:choice-of-anchor D domain-containing protein [Calditrichota bacterium]